jgi:hypothetical protein
MDLGTDDKDVGGLPGHDEGVAHLESVEEPGALLADAEGRDGSLESHGVLDEGSGAGGVEVRGHRGDDEGVDVLGVESRIGERRRPGLGAK